MAVWSGVLNTMFISKGSVVGISDILFQGFLIIKWTKNMAWISGASDTSIV